MMIPVFRPARRSIPALCLFMAACDVPTELPRWNTRWVVPLDSTVVSVGSLLPSGVEVTADGSAFQLSLPGTTISLSLADICGAPCAAFNGRVVPKPAFTSTLHSTIALPADVASVTLTGGRLDVQFSHSFSFDPIRPGGSARGSVTTSFTSGGATLARDSVLGVQTALPANTPLARTLTLAAGRVTPVVDLDVTLASPAGDPVRIDTSERFTVSATPSQVRASEATIRVRNRSITARQVALHLDDVDQTVIDRAQGGAIRFELVNPFQVSGTLDVSITAPGVSIRKPIQAGPGTTQGRIELTRAELRSILGRPDVRLSATGTVSAPQGTISVRPSQALRIRTRLELVLGTEEG
jgi:hypothetical protein